MTVSTTISRVSYSGNGSTVTFTVPFYFIYSTDLKVYKTSSANVQTLLVEGTDYTVTGAGVISGGSITCTTAPSSDYTIIIYRDPDTTQLVDYQANDPFPAETHERALDKLTMIAQRLNDVNDRSFHISDGDTSGATLEIASPEANYLIGWNSTGDALQNVDPSTLATIVSYATAYADTFTGDGTTTSWTLSRNPAVLYNLDVSINGVTQVPVTDYTLSGTTFTTTTAAPLNAVILVKYKEGLPNYSGDSQDVRFVPAGTGAVTTTVQAKLRQTVSVKDFGAVGGAADCSAAVQAAVNALPSSGGRIVFPTDSYTLKDINVIDKESVSFDFGDSVINLSSGAQYAFKMQNTSSGFKKGGTWENVTFGTGSASVGIIWVDGGAWTNQVFNRVFNNSVVAPDLIYYSNNTVPLRNPSNFTFTQIFDRSYGCKYLFHYKAAATTCNFDNFTIKNVLHYANQDGCAVVHFDGAAALYSTFENIYGGMYANNARLVKMTGVIAASRNTWKNLLMEGSGNNRICMDGYYNESEISTVVNYIDESLYTGNQAFYARLTSSKVDHLLVQNASTGNYSTNTAVTLIAGSGDNEIFKVGVLADSGYQNTVYRGKGDYVLATNAKLSFTGNGAQNLFTLPPNEFEVGDTLKIFVGGISGGLYKDLSLTEAGDRTLYTITGGLTTESWSFELTYYVFLSGGQKNLSCYVKAYKGATLQYAEYISDRVFTSNITWALSASAGSWPAGTFFIMNNAYAAPLYNQN